MDIPQLVGWVVQPGALQHMAWHTHTHFLLRFTCLFSSSLYTLLAQVQMLFFFKQSAPLFTSFPPHSPPKKETPPPRPPLLLITTCNPGHTSERHLPKLRPPKSKSRLGEIGCPGTGTGEKTTILHARATHP